MTDLSSYLGPVTVASSVYSETDSLEAGAQAGGYSAWIQSITGDLPHVVPIEGTNRVKLVLSPEQIRSMHEWLDSLMKPGEPSLVEYELGPVFEPWVLGKAIPVGVVVFIGGVIAGYMIARAF